MAKLVDVLVDAGEVGAAQSFVDSGSGDLSMMVAATPATIHPGEHGIVIAMI